MQPFAQFKKARARLETLYLLPVQARVRHDRKGTALVDLCDQVGVGHSYCFRNKTVHSKPWRAQRKPTPKTKRAYVTIGPLNTVGRLQLVAITNVAFKRLSVVGIPILGTHAFAERDGQEHLG